MTPGPFRDLMRKGRRTLHDFMKVGALYYRMDKNSVITSILEIEIRVHDKFLRVGDLAGTNFHYAEVEENSPRAVFMRSDIEPERLFFIRTDEALYQIDSVLPPDDITVTVNLKRIADKRAIERHPTYDPNVRRVYVSASLPGMNDG